MMSVILVGAAFFFPSACGRTETTLDGMATGGSSSTGVALATGGVTSTGGTPGGGSGGDATTGGADGTGAVGGLGGQGQLPPGTATLGSPCDSPGELACAGNQSKLALLCGAQGTWETNVTCMGDDVCDTLDRPSRGTCVPMLADCVGKEPNEAYCDGLILRECGPDSATMTETSCDHGCAEDSCTVVPDPCTNDIDVDCTEVCAERTGNGSVCSDLPACDEGYGLSAALPLTVRTPAASDACVEECGAKTFTLNLPPNGRIRVSVAPDWKMVPFDFLGNEPRPDLCSAAKESSCVILPSTSLGQRKVVLVATDDTAPPRNILVESVSADALCP